MERVRGLFEGGSSYMREGLRKERKECERLMRTGFGVQKHKKTGKSIGVYKDKSECDVMSVSREPLKGEVRG